MAKKSYCTQNNGDCITCSLVNYGLDCANNPVEGMAPIPQLSRKGTKMDRAMAAFDGHKGAQTVCHIKEIIGNELSQLLTGKQYGLVMSAVNRAYHEGRASTGAEVVDGDYLWVNCLNKGFDLDTLKKLEKTETRTQTKVAFDGGLTPLHDYINDNYPGEKRKPYEVSMLPRETWGDWYYIDYATTATWHIKED